MIHRMKHGSTYQYWEVGANSMPYADIIDPPPQTLLLPKRSPVAYKCNPNHKEWDQEQICKNFHKPVYPCHYWHAIQTAYKAYFHQISSFSWASSHWNSRNSESWYKQKSSRYLYKTFRKTKISISTSAAIMMVIHSYHLVTQGSIMVSKILFLCSTMFFTGGRYFILGWNKGWMWPHKFSPTKILNFQIGFCATRECRQIFYLALKSSREKQNYVCFQWLLGRISLDTL